MSLTNTTEQFWDGLQNDDNDDVCGTLYLDLSTLTAPQMATVWTHLNQKHHLKASAFVDFLNLYNMPSYVALFSMGFLLETEYIPESLMGFAKDFNRSTPVSNTHV